MQIMMTGFLGKTKARSFMGELWKLMVEAQENTHGIPTELIEMKKSELQKKMASLKYLYCSISMVTLTILFSKKWKFPKFKRIVPNLDEYILK